MNTIQNLFFIQKYDGVLLDILFGKVYENYVAINLHVAWLIHFLEVPHAFTEYRLNRRGKHAGT